MAYTQKNDGVSTHEESAVKLGECMSVRTVLETKTPKKEIDLKNTSESDLKSIQVEDPFLFYSIPGVRSAKMRMQSVDLSTLVSSSAARQGRRASCPASLGGQPNRVPATQKVRRLSCVSVECHPDMLFLDEMLDDNDGMALDDISVSSDLENFLMDAS